MQSSNELNKSLLTAINADGRIHLVASTSKDVYFLRFAVCSVYTEPRDIQFAWDVVREIGTRVVKDAQC